MDHIAHYTSPIGRITMAERGGLLVGLWFDGQRFDRANLSEYEEGKSDLFFMTGRWLDIYFSKRVPDFTPPLMLTGTPFRQRVLEALLTIPYGTTTTYKGIAMKLGMEKLSCQAVGSAVAHNPISIIVPCHRVVGSDGSLTGYAGGLERKRFLLSLENKEGGPLS